MVTQYAQLIYEENGAMIYEAINSVDMFQYDYYWKTKESIMINGPFLSVDDAMAHYTNFKACLADEKTNVVFVNFGAKKRVAL